MEASSRTEHAMLTLHPVRLNRTNHPLHSDSNGIITSTLCEDVFSLVNVQWNGLHDYLKESHLLGTDVGDTILVDGLLSIFRNLHHKHLEFRDTFLTDLERSCATANDFYRMMETAEHFWTTLCLTYPKLLDDDKTDPSSVLHRESADLLSLYSSDAVYAVQRAHMFVVREIHQSDIPTQLFSRDWEDIYTSNEVVLSLIRTIEDYLYDFHNFLCDDFLYRKVVDSLIRAMVCLYITNLVRKADRVRRKNRSDDGMPFVNPARAVVRMMYDLQLFGSYFENLAKEIPPLKIVVEREMSLMILVHECLGIAVGGTGASSLEEFVIVIHKRTGGNLNVTKHLMGDLWFLAAPPSQRNEIYGVVNMMQAELQLMSSRMKENAVAASTNHRDPLKGIKLVETLKDHYEERVLHEQFALCAPCVGAIKKSAKKKQEKVAAVDISRPLIAPLLDIEQSQPDRFLVTLQDKLLEVLKLHNLRFAKTRQRKPDTFEFSVRRLAPKMKNKSI